MTDKKPVEISEEKRLFIQKLKLLMANKGLNQSQLAAEIGIARTRITKYLSTSYIDLPVPDVLKLLSDYFEVTPSYLRSSARDQRQFVINKKSPDSLHKNLLEIRAEVTPDLAKQIEEIINQHIKENR